MKRKTVVAVLLAVLAALTGCGKEKEPARLWVVTEQSAWNGMNWQTEQIMEQYKKLHPEVTVELEILPQEKTKREQYFRQLRSEISAGRGPDVYLLPTDTTLHGDDWRSWHLQRKVRELEPLFLDVEQVMGNGLFTDIGPYYDADKALKTEELNRAVMDAGTIQEGSIRDGRYILPLRYDFPVLFVDTAKLADYGLSVADVDGGILELLDAAIAAGDQTLACGAEPFMLRTERGFAMLPEPLDYDRSRVTVTAEQITGLLEKIQKVYALAGDANDHRRPVLFQNFYQMYYQIFDDGGIPGYDDRQVHTGWVAGYMETGKFPSRIPMRVGTMDEAVKMGAVSKARTTLP